MVKPPTLERGTGAKLLTTAYTLIYNVFCLARNSETALILNPANIQHDQTYVKT